jgi:hypothetical protein
LLTIPNIGPAGGVIEIKSVELFISDTAPPSGMDAFRLHLYNSPPAVVLDNASFDLTSAEVGRYLGFINLSTPVDLGSMIFTSTVDVNRVIRLLPYSRTLFAELETRGAYTPASGTVHTIKLNAVEVDVATTDSENLLWAYAGGAVPTLDLEFARTKTLNNQVTSTPPVTFTRASSATFIDSAGRLQTAAVDVPRFDHNPTTGESLGLLVEEQRTNSLTYSEDTSQWLTPFNITMSQNQATAPDGASTADQYLETAATGLHIQDGMSFTFVTSTVYTYSVFVKSIGGRNFEIGYPGTIFTDRFARFNLSGSGSVQGSDAGVTASIQAYANGWYRCSATNTCASGASSRISNFVNNDSFARSYAGDVTKGLFIWGAQLEAGAFPTSYIPTTTAAATRSADVASITGANFSSWYRQDEGTVFAENSQSATSGDVAYSYYLDAGGGLANSIYSDVTSGNRRGVVFSGNVVQCATNFGAITSGVQARTAFGLKQDQFGLALNGGSVGTDNSGSIPTGITRIFVGNNSASSAAINGTIKRLTYWPQRLSNSTLQTITQ